MFLLSFPIFWIALTIQTVVLSRLPLIHGTPDLVMLVLIAWGLQEQVERSWLWAITAGLMVSFVSAMPFFAPLICYLVVIFGITLLQRRVWRTPILVMFFAAIGATVIQHGIYFVALFVEGNALPLQESITNVTLPSTLLNLLLALPVFLVVSDLARWVHPREVS